MSTGGQRKEDRGAGATDCETLLRLFGLQPNHKCYHYCLYAVGAVREHPGYLLLVTKLLYPAVANRFHTSSKAVEGNLSLAAKRAWERNPALLRELTGEEGPVRPARFLAVLVENTRA